ncbi:MAG: hypothetical protein AAB583_01945 [Patescibacteria group bacterium]
MDIIELFIYALPISVLGFIFEAYPRFLNRGFGVDIWTHLLYLREYHRQKGIPKRIENGFLVSGKYDYPPAFILILSRFPQRLVERYEFVFSPFFDFIHLLIIFFISFQLTNSLFIALITQSLYILTPIIVLENSSATPRSLGYTLFTIMLMSLFIYTQQGNMVYFLVSIFSGSFIFLSHRLTTQGLLFFLLFFTLYGRNIIYIGVFFLSFFLALLFSKGFYLRVLQGHVGNLKFWYKNIEYRFAHQIRGNYREYKTQDFVFSVYNQFLKFPPFVLAVTNTWTLPVFYIFFFLMPSDPLMQKMVLWVIFSYALALSTTWVPRLRFLGEGQRYLELSAFPTAFLSAWLLNHWLTTPYSLTVASGYIFVGICALITIVVIQKKAIIKDKLRTLTPSLQKMYDYLRSLKQKPKLLCIPHQITTNTIYHTGCPVLVNADYTNIEKISDIYPFLRKPVKEIMREYGLDAILLNEDYAAIQDLRLKNYHILKRYNNYVLLKTI